MAHGCVYILLATVLCSTYQPSTAEIGHLVQGDLSSSFKALGRGSIQWRSFQEKGSTFYYVCYSDDWLQTTDELNTAGIQELTVKVVYKYFNKTSPKIILNKTEFSLGDLTNDRITPYLANGIINRGRKNVTSTELLPASSPKLRILIKTQDRNNCMNVYAVEITYRFCARKVFFDIAEFPKTFAPRNGSLYPLKVDGNCSYGGKNTPVAYCNSNGEWTFNETLPCKCSSGQIMTSTGCVELSSLIREVKAVRLSNTRAKIFWKQKPKIHYDVVCKKCEDLKCDQSCPETVRLEEHKPSVPGENSSDITGLERGHDYLFTVVGKIKGVYENYWNETSKQLKLKALPEKVRNLTFASQDHDRVVLTWLPPSNIDSARVIYEIGCRVNCLEEPCMANRCKKLKFIPSRRNLLQTNVSISGFRNEGLLYAFEVFAKRRLYNNSEETYAVDWNFVAINYTDFKEAIKTVSKSFNVVDVVIGVSVLILAVIITILATRFYNRWKRRKHALSFDCENADEPLTHCSEVPLTDVSTHYVDPSNYDSIENVLKKFTKKLNEKNLKTEAIIGEGEFGVVWKGYLEINGKERTVAVKSLRSGLSAKLRRDFLAEASVMGQFKDPNVISLHGVVVKHNTVKIVMEFMSNGSLDQYLLENNGGLTTLQLLGMARGIASGMNYLSMRNFIHRDLAARNILVDENLSCKVSDFGLTREICQSSNYETSGGKIPIRWTAPEVIKHRKSFIASDVWSYGVVLWEIMSFGQRPYWDWDNFRVLQEIEGGYRLPAPLKCPKTVHTLMLQCWQKERSSRPTFVHILGKLDEWIRSPEMIHHSPATKARSNTVDLNEAQSPIDKWLNTIKMGKYAANFTEAGYTQISQIINLTEQDLSDMGITLVGHRHKIHQSIPLAS